MSHALAIAGMPYDASLQPIAKSADPRRELRLGVALGAILLVATFGWGTMARLDAAVITPGVVRTGGSLTQIQTPNGGVVGRVLVQNGMQVPQGAPLVEFSNPAILAQERSLAGRVFGLQAEIARLEAGLQGRSRIGDVPAFANLVGEDRDIALAALLREETQLLRERSITDAEAGVIRDRRAQLTHQVAGQSERQGSVLRQKHLNEQELRAMQSLLDRGLTTRPRVIALQRAAAAYDGEIGGAQAEMARLRSQSQEVQLQLLSAREERARQNADRLRLAQGELQALLPQWGAARSDRLRATVRAPFAGTVSAATMPREGNVIPAGTALFDLVPTARGYVVEARINVRDAAEIAPGQTAQVRLSTLRSLSLPPLEGRIVRVSANSIVDNRSGESFYLADVHVSDKALRSAGVRAEAAGGVRPGTPVEVIVPTRGRTAIEYLLDPLLQRTRTTFSER